MAVETFENQKPEDTIKTTNDNCATDGFFPLKGTQCAKFYRCVNGVAHHFFCPSETVFDSRSSVCNFKDQVICPE